MTIESPAINHEALLAKSKYYIGKAIARSADNDLEEYQLWASLALELLGKAALARIHPCLVADPTHQPSMFAAAGVARSTDIKTITAKTVYERLKDLCPDFDPTIQKFCIEISLRRNSELHSGDTPFKAMQRSAWEGKFWHACKIVLEFSEMTLSDWLGDELAAGPEKIIETRLTRISAEVLARIETRRKEFNEQNQNVRDEKLSRKFHSFDAEVKGLFSFYALNEKEWPCVCPSCGGEAFLAGDVVSEEITGHDEEWATWETVARTYSADEFACPRCLLVLVGTEELNSSGLALSFVEEEEREIEYEPEYGNC